MSREIKKPETTDQYHRIPVRDCEITSTITISEKEGIKALYCGNSKEIATYLFDVDKWSMAEAKTWVSEHKKSNDCNKKKSINRKNHLSIKGKISLPADIVVKEDGRRIIAGYACYDDKTEIYTKDGWKYFSELDGDEYVLGRTKTGKSKWVKIINNMKYEYNGELIRLKNNKIDLLVTPNHKLYYKNKYGKTFFNDASDAYGKWNLKFFKNIDIESDIQKSTEFAKFIGYYVSEGGITYQLRNKGKNSLTNTDENIICDMDNSLNLLDIQHSTNWRLPSSRKPITISGREINSTKPRGDIVICNYELTKEIEDLCGRYSINKHLPDGFLYWNKDAKEALFNSLINGDGYWNDSGGRDSGTYVTISKRLSDEVQMLALSLGYSALVHKYMDMEYKHNVYHVYISNVRKGISTKKENWSKEYYDGYVYCVEVPSPHLIFVRRNGKPCWCGNSIAEVDLEDDLITTEALKMGLEKLIEDERYANIMLSHSDIQIGHILKEYNGLKTHVDDKGLFLIAEIRKGFKYADDVWEDIVNGDINGFSIAGYVEEGGEEQVCNGDTCWNEIKNIVLFETSVCQFPCNQKSGFIVLSKNLKSYKCECLECGYNIETEKHCNELICPKCGGEMRRAERPGVGKDTDSNEIKSNDVHDNVSEKEGDEMPDKEEKSDKVEENKLNEEVEESEEPNPLDELHKGFETLTEKTSGLERRLESLEKVIQDMNKSEEEEVEEEPEEKSEETSEETEEEDVEEKSEDSEEECEDCKASKEKEETSEESEESEDIEKSEEDENVEKSEEEGEVDELETIKKSIKDKDELIESMEKTISELKSRIEELEEEEQPTKSKVSKSDEEEDVDESNIVVKKGEVYFKEY